MQQNIKLLLYSTPFEGNSGSLDCDPVPPETYTPTNPLTFTPFTSAFLELTPVCNSRCVGCSNVFITDRPTRKMEIAQAPLPISEWRKILTKLAPHVDRVSVTGGEATLYKHFTEFTELLAEFKLRFTLFTNARWTQPTQLINNLKNLPNLNGLLISMHGQDAATHESFTLIKGSYQEAIDNIKLATASGIPVTLSTIINKYSYQQVAKIYELGQQLGVRQVAFNRYVGQVHDEAAPAPLQLKQALSEVDRLRVQGLAVTWNITVPQCFHPSSATGCEAGESFFTLDPWGNVKPCNHTPMILGNLRYDSVETIQQSEKLNYWRNLTPVGCHSCAAHAICGGGCRAEAMLNQAQGDTLIQGPYLPEQTNFLMLPDYLHPLATESFQPHEFQSWVDQDTRQVLTDCLNGTIPLKEFGVRYGQSMLDLIGALHHEGVVEFV